MRLRASCHRVREPVRRGKLLAMSGKRLESELERKRRAWVEREEGLLDLTEQYEQDRAAATTPEEQKRVMEEFTAKRRTHREEDVRAGRRPPGVSVVMHQIMWARWLEVAVEHELRARDAFKKLLEGRNETLGDELGDEFRASLVAVTASAHTAEALFGDIKYRIPAQERRAKRYLVLCHAFKVAFGVRAPEHEALKRELGWLFERRDLATHPYTEATPPKAHPAGIDTGAEHSDFNAVTSGRAVDAVMMALGVAASPPGPLNRWIERWAASRAPYHHTVVDPLQQRRQGAALSSQPGKQTGNEHEPV